MRGRESPSLLQKRMVDKLKILDIIHDKLDGSDKFLVNLKITPDNRIYIDIDGDNGINIDDCIELSRAIENSLDRNEEDFELNVSSAGADSPLKMPRQYRKNIGRNLTVLRNDGSEAEGRLTEADDDHIVLQKAGTKKMPPQDTSIGYDEIKTASLVLEF